MRESSISRKNRKKFKSKLSFPSHEKEKRRVKKKKKKNRRSSKNRSKYRVAVQLTAATGIVTEAKGTPAGSTRRRRRRRKEEVGEALRVPSLLSLPQKASRRHEPRGRTK